MAESTRAVCALRSSPYYVAKSSPNSHRRLREHGSHEVDDLGRVSSLHQAEGTARRASHRSSLKFAPHPILSPVLPLWGASQLHSREKIRELLAKARVQRAQAELAARADQARNTSTKFADAIEDVTWAAIHRLPNSTSRQRLTFLRVKGQCLSGWDHVNSRRGCPHCAAAGTSGGSVYHIVWTCNGAARLWARIRALFARLGLWRQHDQASKTEFLRAVFSLRLPRVPHKIWEQPSLCKCQPHDDDDTRGGLYPALQAVWQQLVLETLVVIISWRNGAADPQRAWSPMTANAIHSARCQQVLETLSFKFARRTDLPPYASDLVDEIRGLLRGPPDQPALPPLPNAPARLLFFAGGTRGNPGPGGAGSVVINLDRTKNTPTVLWSAATRLSAASTTNTCAEYTGLITGLQAAKENHWSGLYIIGASELILRQLRDHRPHKNPTLLSMYRQARTLADQLDVREWNHHLRAHNRMANSLANLAGEDNNTHVFHPTSRPGHTDLPQLIASDLHPWLLRQVDP